MTNKQKFYSKVFELSLDMLIKLPYDEILEAAKGVGGYNEFNPEDLEKMMVMFDEIIPRKYYNQGNPNNGMRAYDLSIGREGSMVLYYSIYDIHSEAVNTVKEKEARLKDIALGIGKADEFNIEEEGNWTKIRIWWD